MNRRIFTAEQIEALLKNKHVAKCSAKTITYTKEFKLLAVGEHQRGLNATQIFRNAGFDLDLVGRNLPYRRMNHWLSTYKERGLAGLSQETRGRGRGGGRPKTKGLTDAETIKRLEATVAYLRAENDFLIKLRGGKTE